MSLGIEQADEKDGVLFYPLRVSVGMGPTSRLLFCLWQRRPVLKMLHFPISFGSCHLLPVIELLSHPSLPSFFYPPLSLGRK